MINTIQSLLKIFSTVSQKNTCSHSKYLHLVCLTHSLIHHFETVPNPKKLYTTTEMWLLKDLKVKITKVLKMSKDCVGKGNIACYEQFLLLPQSFQKICAPPGWLSGERVRLMTWWL